MGEKQTKKRECDGAYFKRKCSKCGHCGLERGRDWNDHNYMAAECPNCGEQQSGFADKYDKGYWVYCC